MQLLVNVVLLGIGIVASRILGNYIPLGNPFRYMIWFWFGKHIDTIKKFWVGRSSGMEKESLLYFCYKSSCLSLAGFSTVVSS